jgi:hypothetical protein
MLFAVNGLIYWTKPEPGKGNWSTWHALFNIVAGFALVNVALIHCQREHRTLHLIAAFTFFICCALICVGNDRKDRLTYFTSIAIMVVGGILLLGNMFGWFVFYPNLFTIFGFESIVLWVTGINYIMISLSRVPVPAHV